jgi:hypothetical protein
VWTVLLLRNTWKIKLKLCTALIGILIRMLTEPALQLTALLDTLGVTNERLEAFGEQYWVSGDGEVIPYRSVKVKDMFDDHLINVIIHIQKNLLKPYKLELYYLFIATAHIRGIEPWRYRSCRPTPFEYNGEKVHAERGNSGV